LRRRRRARRDGAGLKTSRATARSGPCGGSPAPRGVGPPAAAPRPAPIIFSNMASRSLDSRDAASAPARTTKPTAATKDATPRAAFAARRTTRANDASTPLRSARVIASPTMTQGEEYVLVNPEILEARGRELGMEGCLSLPGISGEIARAKVIRFHALNRQGEPVEMEAKDFFARIIQHEVDHLNGILLMDRVDFDRRQEILASYQRL